MNRVFDIAAGIVTMGIVFVVVSNANSAAVISSVGNAFSHSIAAAQGRAA